MLNKKKVATIIAVGIHFKSLKPIRKARWTDYRVGWTAQPRINWSKQ